MQKDQVYGLLRNEILTLKREPLSVFDEKSLMHKYDIGRTPLREVFVRLENDGLINVIPRIGTFVTQVDINILRSDIEIRGPLEEIVVSLLIKRMTDGSLEKFKQMLDSGVAMCQNEKPDDAFSDILLHEADLHQFLYSCTGNILLQDFMKRIQSHSMRYWHSMPRDFENVFLQFKSLYELYEALADRDLARAKKAAYKHTEDFAQMVREHISSI